MSIPRPRRRLGSTSNAPGKIGAGTEQTSISNGLECWQREGGGFEKAKALLLEAAKLFPEDVMIQYNLACYCAQLGQLDAAQEYLHKSYELGDAKQIKLVALDDDDLKPLWESEAN